MWTHDIALSLLMNKLHLVFCKSQKLSTNLQRFLSRVKTQKWNCIMLVPLLFKPFTFILRDNGAAKGACAKGIELGGESTPPHFSRSK